MLYHMLMADIYRIYPLISVNSDLIYNISWKT